jgi:hypothetical protein
MKKRLFNLPAPIEAWLVAESARLDVSISELVRRVLDEARKRSERSR